MSRQCQSPPLSGPTSNELGLPPNMDQKYTKLIAKLSNYPHLINRNEHNQVMIKGKPVAGSNFQDLVGSLFRRKAQSNLKGEQEFIHQLSEIGITANEISTSQSKSLLSALEFHDPQSGTGRTKKKPADVKSSQNHSSASTKKLGPPPGKRPRLLRLYF